MSATDDFEDHDGDELKQVMLKTRKKGATRITLTGGEFLMRKDHRELIEYAISIGYRNIYFISNGIYLKESALKWLSTLKVKETLKSLIPTLANKIKPLTIGFGISLDGLEGNGLIRKYKNSKPVPHEKILEKIKLATGYGLYVTVNTTICNATTAAELPQMYKELLSLDIDRWQVDQVFMSGRSTESAAVQDADEWLGIAKESYFKILNEYIRVYPHKTKMKLEIVQLFRSSILEHGFKIIDTDDYHPCGYQFGSVIVENGSDVRFCPSLRYDNDDIFNILENDLSEKQYTENLSFKKFSELTLNDLPCKDCRYKFISHGGCRGNSVSYNSRVYSKDPVCCALAPFLEKRIVPLLPYDLQKQYKSGIFNEGKIPEEIL
ncbi:radical SAM/SPASM domain-containing protein [Pectobacterium aroidearum]|uniref:radical SAM/SPASM domain-containing protein n=1 Tax=Pectobacterium aroidearum TaxID=1201031 RepID=UPI0026227C60|nr:radical SAM protein [Pectobacterium aroidearum]WKA64582.1 radical SAM protein [Pectobacterium aroidearum]